MKSNRPDPKTAKPAEPRLSRRSSQVLPDPKPKDLSSNNIKVVARFRPKNEYELQLEEGKPPVAKHISPEAILIQEETFTFDRIFECAATQGEVFEAVGRPVVEDVLAGYNGTVFAYGQTGSGKTFSMMGVDVYDASKRGIIPRAAATIFDTVNESDSEVEFILRCSMLEIYKETLRDLLAPEGADLRIKEDPHKGIYVQGLTEVFVTSEEEMLEVIAIGEQMRTVSATKCNAVSSRSHQLFFLEVKQHFPNDSEKRGILNLVDLAGSEKINHSGVTGNNLQEAKKINLSLSALGNVIHSLMVGSEHIPYRDSKLTRLLQESLGGNYKTTLLVALSPSSRHFDETFSSLKFAQRAKHIKTKASINLKSSPETYQLLIDRLTEELKRTQGELMAVKTTVGGQGVQGREETACQMDQESTANVDNFKSIVQQTAEQTQKIHTLEEETRDLREKVKESDEKMRSLEKKLLKEQRESLEYKMKYHNAVVMMRKETDETALLRRHNSELTDIVGRLKSALEALDRRYSSLIAERMEPESSTVLEFEDWEGEGEAKWPEEVVLGLSGSEDGQMPGIRQENTPKKEEIGKFRLKFDVNASLESQIRSLQNSLLQ